MSLEELNILKFGLNHSSPPLKIRKTDMFASFETSHCFLRQDLRNDIDKVTLKSQLSHLTDWYILNYQPSRSTLTKNCILRKLRNDNEILILRLDKGSGVVVLSLRDCEKSVKNIINDNAKLKNYRKILPLNENVNYKVFSEHWKIINVCTM